MKETQSRRLNICIAVFVAVALWFYVLHVENVQSVIVLYDVPVVLRGESALTEQNLMITEQSRTDVDLEFSGRRSEFLTAYRNSFHIEVDLSEITEPGVYELSGRVVEQGDEEAVGLSIEEEENLIVSIVVDSRITRSIPIVSYFTGSLASGYDREPITLSEQEISVTGAATAVNAISEAYVELDLEGVRSQVEAELNVLLRNEEGVNMDQTELDLSIHSVTASMYVVPVQEIPLLVNIVEGGGLTEAEVEMQIHPSHILVAGDEAVLENVESIVLGTVRLEDVDGVLTQSYPIRLPANLENRSDETDALLTLQLVGVETWGQAVRPQISGLAEGLVAIPEVETVTIRLQGTPEAFANFQSFDLRVIADLSAVEEPTESLRVPLSVSVEGEIDIGVIGSYEMSYRIEAAE